MIFNLLLGIAAVYLYAVIRTRFGAGPRTAIRAGLLTWAGASLLWSVTVMMGLFPWTVFLARVSASLPIALLATLAGASLCRKTDDAPARARTGATSLMTTAV